MKTPRLMRLRRCQWISTPIVCGVRLEKTCLLGLETTKVQTSLCTTQFLCYSIFESIISQLATSEVPRLFSRKVRKKARVRSRYNQVPHLSQDTKWESNKITINITIKSQEVSPFPAGNHMVAMNIHAKTWQTQDINNTNDPQKNYCLKTVS